MKYSLNLEAMPTPSLIRICLVDDHQILLEGIEALLSNQDTFDIVAKFNDGAQLLEYPDLSDIDVLVMDMKMKSKDGIEVLKELISKGYKGKCIFLSSYNDLKLVNEAISIGAYGYITKSNASHYLQDAIEKVTNGEVYYSPDIKDRILNAFSKSDTNEAESQMENGILRQLTEREIEVLKLIALQFTSEEIAQQLYIARSTVDTHRKNLIYKLKVKNAVGLGLFAERHGLI